MSGAEPAKSGADVDCGDDVELEEPPARSLELIIDIGLDRSTADVDQHGCTGRLLGKHPKDDAP